MRLRGGKDLTVAVALASLRVPAISTDLVVMVNSPVRAEGSLEATLREAQEMALAALGSVKLQDIGLFGS